MPIAHKCGGLHARTGVDVHVRRNLPTVRGESRLSIEPPGLLGPPAQLVPHPFGCISPWLVWQPSVSS